MSVKETINTVFAKLPFKALAEKIPAEARAKVPLLDKAIPFANQIVCGLAVLLVVTVVACSGKGGNSGGSSGGSSSGSSVNYTMANESDFEVKLLADGTAIITKYNGSGGNIAVPATIQGVQVTQIDEGVFRAKSNLTGIQLPEGLKGIQVEKKYFSGAFQDSGISTIIIPDSVTVFGENMLSGTKNLRSFTFPASLIATKTIPEGMFAYSGLSGSLVIPEGIETIGGSAFGYCKSLTSVTLPSTIKSLNGSFYYCSELTEVVIPASVTRIQWGGGAFSGCSKMNLASQARLRELGYTGDF